MLGRGLVGFLLLAAGASGCALERSPLAASDGGAPRDAPRLDVEGLDATLALDAPDGGPTCSATSATETRCDRIDDDCDGVIDDGVCSGCAAFTVAGRAYLSCPGPVTGMDAWSGACRTAGTGYDLVIFSSGPERDGVVAALAGLAIAGPHFIGLNDFEANGTYVWRDRSTTFVPSMIGANDPARRFVVLLGDGTYDEAAAADTAAFLCEIEVAPDACRAAREGATCDGVDDDCNGLVDDGIDCAGRGCTGSTFWDHVYYLCTDPRDHGEAVRDCLDGMGALTASLNHGTEHLYAAALTRMEVWIGLAQATGAGAVDAGWQWSDPASTYGIPVTTGILPWDTGEPNDGGDLNENDQENCGPLLAPARNGSLDDRGCNARLPFLCERRWSY